jgi:hypothetical protein
MGSFLKSFLAFCLSIGIIQISIILHQLDILDLFSDYNIIA